MQEMEMVEKNRENSEKVYYEFKLFCTAEECSLRIDTVDGVTLLNICAYCANFLVRRVRR